MRAPQTLSGNQNIVSSWSFKSLFKQTGHRLFFGQPLMAFYMARGRGLLQLPSAEIEKTRKDLFNNLNLFKAAGIF